MFMFSKAFPAPEDFRVPIIWPSFIDGGVLKSPGLASVYVNDISESERSIFTLSDNLVNVGVIKKGPPPEKAQ